jgi:acyl-CoA thioester hydrolase
MDNLSVELKPEIKTYDIDIAGHVNNIAYVRWFEDLRTKFFNTYINLRDLLSNNFYPVVISTDINYKKSLRLFDKPVGIMSIECFNHGIIVLKTEIKINGKIAAYGKQKCLLMNLKTGKMDKEKIKSILENIRT